MATPDFNLVPGALNLNGVVGDDFSVLLDFSVDLSGYTFDARVLLDNNPYGRYQQITITNTNLALGRITLSLSDAQTRLLGPISNKKWFISWSQGADIRTVLSGGFTLNKPWAVTDYSPTTTDQTIVIQTPTISVEVIGGVGGAVLWGDIQGDIEDQTDLIEYLDTNFLPWSTDIVLVTEGDSITAADGVHCWPVYLSTMSYLNGRVTLHNGAVGGSDIEDAIARYPTTVYPYRPAATGASRSLFMPLMGANNTPIIDAQATFDLLEGYLQEAVDDGFEVWACVMLHNYNDDAQADQFRLLLKQSRLPVMILDTASVLPNYSDTAMFVDALHPTNVGQQCLAAYINNALFAFGSIPNQNGSMAGQNQFAVDIRGGTIAGLLSALFNARLNGNWLSNDGGNEGIQISNAGVVSFGSAASNQSIQSAYFGEGVKYRLLPDFDSYSWGWYNSRGIDGEVHMLLASPGAVTIGQSGGLQNIILRANGNGTFTGTLSASNLSGTNTGDQYGGVTTSTALRVLRRNAANTAYEFATLTGDDISGVVLTGNVDQNIGGNKVFNGNVYSTFAVSSSSIVQTAGLVLQPIINQSGTAGYDTIRVDVTENTTGSGAKSLIKMRVGGSDRFTVSNTGAVTAASTITGSNLSGTNTGDQYGGVTASAANQYLRRNAANSAYEYAPKTEYITIVPTNGQAIAFNDNPNDQVFYIAPVGDLTDLQLILPSNATSINTQKVVFCVTHNITNLDLTGATTIFNTPVTMNAGDCFQFYKMASNVWARVIT